MFRHWRATGETFPVLVHALAMTRASVSVKHCAGSTTSNSVYPLIWFGPSTYTDQACRKQITGRCRTSPVVLSATGHYTYTAREDKRARFATSRMQLLVSS